MIYPSCVKTHRNSSVKNTQIIEDDVNGAILNGVFTTCDFPFPGFVPLDYTPQNIIITEQAPVDNQENSSSGKQNTEIPEAKKKK